MHEGAGFNPPTSTNSVDLRYFRRCHVGSNLVTRVLNCATFRHSNIGIIPAYVLATESPVDHNAVRSGLSQ